MFDCGMRFLAVAAYSFVSVMLDLCGLCFNSVVVLFVLGL